MTDPLFFWIGFHLVFAALLLCDFLIFRKRALTAARAGYLSCFWILIALIFNGLIYFTQGQQAAGEFFTAYLVEKALSIDNLFVFLLLFRKFGIQTQQQSKILFWGILGAIVFRLLFILLGIKLLALFHWMVYLFGGFLMLMAIRLWMQPIAYSEKRSALFDRLSSSLPLLKKPFLVLLQIEAMDILFAIDSIPAVLAITRNAFIAYTSNILALLGLRALFFVLAPLLGKWRYLNCGLSCLLFFIGIKMLLSPFYTVPLFLSLLIIIAILSLTALFSRSKRVL
ncbi:MAG TPA: TerC family protein [Rhabdochlamydiaceae bacterium]|jgi:tellurite resistance protein TerC